MVLRMKLLEDVTCGINIISQGSVVFRHFHYLEICGSEDQTLVKKYVFFLPSIGQ